MSDGRKEVRGGFSLIEVLIGILVLALGLVGLAAVFPTVVRQQQFAADQSLGVSVGKSAVATLRVHKDLSRPLADANYREQPNGPAITTESNNNAVNPLDLVGWSVLTWDDNWSADGAWQLPTEAPFASASGGMSIDPSNGYCVIGQAGGTYVQRRMNGVEVEDPRMVKTGGVVITSMDRLMPKSDTPRFVWDFVVRRQDLGARHTGTPGVVNNNNRKTYRDDGVQIAVFVRRIDTGIRVPSGTLYEALDASSGGNKVPVAASATNVPTLDGVARYSMVQPLEFVFGSDANGPRFDLLDLNGPNAALLPYAAQIGQRFVDQLGGVHKVVEVLESGNPATRRVRLESAMRSDYLNAAPPAGGPMRLIFVPQIPASVEVFSTSPGDGS